MDLSKIKEIEKKLEEYYDILNILNNTNTNSATKCFEAVNIIKEKGYLKDNGK